MNMWGKKKREREIKHHPVHYPHSLAAPAAWHVNFICFWHMQTVSGNVVAVQETRVVQKIENTHSSKKV